MAKLTTECPSCRDSLEVTRLSCPGCAMQIEGKFELPSLLRLDRDELEFVLDFVRCSGSVKDLCTRRGLSYPTIRNRLAEIVEKLSRPEVKMESKRQKILNAIAKGDLSVKEGVRKLKELES